ncbi:MAG: hypothetical protein AAGA23_18940 [Pseudomonadota bacterium]
MPNLRRLMTEFGFESNDDYEFQMRCFLEQPVSHLRCLNIEGDLPRRKTAFAQALAHALEYPHVLYHDFTQEEVVHAGDDNDEAPLSAFDRTMTEACAYSEAEPTILIIDQLQQADFKHHIRLNTFVRTGEWAYSLATMTANRRNLLVFLISEAPIYHSLQKVSYRLWADPGNVQPEFSATDFGLESQAQPVFDALGQLFMELGVAPTPGEMSRVAEDLRLRVRTADALRHSLYGWTEGIDHGALHSPDIAPAVERVVAELSSYLGVDEIEMVSHEPD